MGERSVLAIIALLGRRSGKGKRKERSHDAMWLVKGRIYSIREVGRTRDG